jgi:hypothetical protein
MIGLIISKSSNPPISRCFVKGSRFFNSFQPLAASAALLFGARPADGANLLANSSFESNSGQAVPAGWTYFAPPTLPGGTEDYWIVDTNSVGCSHMAPNSGTFFWKEWFAFHNGTNNVAGIYQTLGSSPGATYQASGWLATSSCDQLGGDCLTWLQVEFLNASSNALALYKSAQFSANVAVDTWVQFQVTNACDLSHPVATGDPYFTTYAITGHVNQLVAPPGTALVRYRYCYLTATNEGGSSFFDDAALNQASGSVPPLISNLFPLNMIFVNPGDGLSFNVSSPSGYTINASGIHLTLNGTDVSASLGVTGSSSSKTVTYSGLQSNTTYNASISVTDVSNLTSTASSYFETTWVGIPPIVYLWEAEDFDFTNGLYIDNPALCAAAGNPACYYGKVGNEGVDEHLVGNAPSHFYRPDDAIGIAPSGDYTRKDHYVAGVEDYAINPFNGVSGGDSEWLNYTRDWPNGSFWVIGRVSTDVGLSGTNTLSLVNPDSSTTDLGTFSINGGQAWTAFQNVFLKDTNGNNVVVTLNGKATLRVTSGGNLLPGFFALVAGQVDLPNLSNLYPTGARPFEYTNTLSFNVSTTGGATFAANAIAVNLDGYDVSANLNITGSTTVKNVVYPALMPNAIHVAIITATNSLGHGIRVTNRFDTFDENNYMVEAEDFDFNGGQFVDPWQPDAYSGLGATTNIDFQHTTLDGQNPFGIYRSDGIPEDKLGTHDYLRQAFILAIDYVLTFFAGNDWANYTRVYPAGSFYVYGRFSGGGPFTMYLDQVVSGATTPNQVTKRLGQWTAVGKDYVTFQWVPLTDSGQAAPVAIKLNGQTTLRITTAGDCNPNYFMLVPATGISLTAARQGNNTVISFPTLNGANYRVFYRTDLNSASWVLLTSVLGNGSVKSVSDPLTPTRRFYRVVAP